tara:strand:- start:290 stop:418 length:129 start_codon:yes stop_codon:yes gene_type:complete
MLSFLNTSPQALTQAFRRSIGVKIKEETEVCVFQEEESPLMC